MNPSEEHCIMRGLIVCPLCHILFGWYNHVYDGWGMYTNGKHEIHKKFWSENVKGRNKLQLLGFILILKDKCSESVIWIHLAYDKDQQWAAQNFHFPIS